EVFWVIRLSAEQDNLLAAWSWAVDTGNVDTAFAILAGFAPCEVWSSYPLLLPGPAALELPGATEHPGYPLALAVSAVLASFRAAARRRGAVPPGGRRQRAPGYPGLAGRGGPLRRPGRHRAPLRRVCRRRARLP